MLQLPQWNKVLIHESLTKIQTLHGTVMCTYTLVWFQALIPSHTLDEHVILIFTMIYLEVFSEVTVDICQSH